MMNWVIMWEEENGDRKWEAVGKEQVHGFLEKLIKSGVHPAKVMAACNPAFFHWVWKDYHGGLSDVHFGNINETICGSAPIESKHEPLNVTKERIEYTKKFGWLAPDGRFFGCGYGGHSNLADKIVGKVQGVYNPERYLEDLGWAKILAGGKTCGTEYAIGMGLDKKLTDAQIKVLTSMQLEHSWGVEFFL